ncbi:MAG TPA: molybdopterin-guanine dinucleotide biosynthesis protein B [Candidatus Thermoplasmatota archaeon]|nr:molybdopterin-guanine dinucleotide biosynthesis protein B [Candidatus Thermoplasmatota archaeon]
MLEPVVFGVYGSSDAGKTTLLVRLVEQLTTKGYKVATIKRTNKAISLDTEEKDTWRHHDAGATLSVFSSTIETDFLVHKPMSSSAMVQRITDFDYYDVVLIEGADDPQVKKIQVGAGEERDNTICRYDDNIEKVLQTIEDEVHKHSRVQRLQITVNGKGIPLTEFPEEFITNTLEGMLRSLKGVDRIETVAIQLKK